MVCMYAQRFLQYDCFMAKHVDRLHSAIRRRAFVQYFRPYTSVNLHTMADAFQTRYPKHTCAPSERRGVGVDDGAILPNLTFWFLVCSVTDLEAELAQLILTEQLDARIDSDKKVCTASTPHSAAAHHHGRAC